MRKFGMVPRAFWQAARTSKLSPAAKLIGVFLIASEYQTIAGISRAPSTFIAHDLQMAVEEVERGIVELEAAGIIMHDPADGWTWCVHYLENFPACGASQIKAAVSALESVPADCRWRDTFLRKYGSRLGIRNHQIEPEPSTLPNTFPDTPATPSQHPVHYGNGNEMEMRGIGEGEARERKDATSREVADATFGKKISEPEKPKSKPAGRDAEHILRHLNQKVGRRFRFAAETLNPIAARLAEGATVGQCEEIIDVLVDRCGSDGTSRAFLTPQAIFRKDAFADRLAQLRAKPDRAVDLAGAEVRGHA